MTTTPTTVPPSRPNDYYATATGLRFDKPRKTSRRLHETHTLTLLTHTLHDGRELAKGGTAAAIGWEWGSDRLRHYFARLLAADGSQCRLYLLTTNRQTATQHPARLLPLAALALRSHGVAVA